jgi:hypothetical protein
MRMARYAFISSLSFCSQLFFLGILLTLIMNPTFTLSSKIQVKIRTFGLDGIERVGCLLHMASLDVDMCIVLEESYVKRCVLR